MGWQTESSIEHEGWVAPMLADGRLAGGSTAVAVLVGADVVPEGQVVAFRAACDCGWTGEVWRRVSELTAVDEQSRQLYTATGFNDNVPEHVEELMWREWRHHIAPIEGIADVAEAAGQYAEAGARLTKTVVAARLAGATWAQVGTAVGISRQTAHERWQDAERRALAGQTQVTRDSDPPRV